MNIDTETLPWRTDCSLVRALGVLGDLEICHADASSLPSVRCTLSKQITARASITVRIHSRAGIPLAYASVDVNPGDQAFEAPVALLAMEGYSHLGRRARQDVERRVWSRRAYATGSVA